MDSHTIILFRILVDYWDSAGFSIIDNYFTKECLNWYSLNSEELKMTENMALFFHLENEIKNLSSILNWFVKLLATCVEKH